MSQPAETFGANLLATCARVPHHEAIVSADGRRYTWGETLTEVERRVAALAALGLRPGDRVAVWLPNIPEFVFAEFACAILGLVVVPVNMRFRAAEAADVLVRSRAVLLLTQRRFLTNDYIGRLHEIAAGEIGSGEAAAVAALPDLRTVVLVDGPAVPGSVTLTTLLERAGTQPAADLAALAARVNPADPVLIFWTSGSTGRPKGAVISHSCIGNVRNWTTLAAGINATDRILTSFPVFYIAGNFWCVLAAMVHGATLVMSAEFDPPSIIEACRREAVTVLSGIPTLLKEIVHHEDFDRAAFATVRVGFFGGASMPYQDIVTLAERIGYQHLLQAFGMTETQGLAISTTINDPREIQLQTCGELLPGFELKLVDPDSGEVIEGAGAGEAWFRGRTHLVYEGLTAAERAPFYSDDGYFRSGDILRRRDDGRYEFVTRIKDLIKVGGENVAAAEIERVLKAHPAVFNIQVIGVPDPRRGEIPVAFVEPADPAAPPTLATLNEWAAARMAPFKLPRELRLLSGDEWPRTASAKIARFRLRELL